MAELPTPADLDAVPAAELPALLLQLTALLATASARLAVVSSTPVVAIVAGDDVVDVHEAARLARRSVSWMRKHGHALPGFVQPTGRGGRVGWSRRTLAAWATGGGTPC